LATALTPAGMEKPFGKVKLNAIQSMSKTDPPFTGTEFITNKILML
jgi:hypothetical protein